jgi:hypothetical protein
LYIIYFESGKEAIDFLIDKFDAYNLDKDGLRHHKSLIHCLRTNFQHGLDLSDDRSIALKKKENDWFQTYIGNPYPQNEIEWKICLDEITITSTRFLSSLMQCIEHIKNDESANRILKDWNTYCSHYHDPYEFDEIISIVANDMGMDALDVVKHRKRHFASWSQELSNLYAGYDFKTEAAKLVQQSLLQSPAIPLTTQDLMSALGIRPGPSVILYLRKAIDSYISSPCDKAELLRRMILVKQAEDESK